jgi:hypothetical protein
MSINRNARTECVEVLLNPAERAGIEALCKARGIGLSPFLRGLGNRQVRLNDSEGECGEESRHCRDVPIASRASSGRRASSRGHAKCPGRGGAGGTHRVLQV